MFATCGVACKFAREEMWRTAGYHVPRFQWRALLKHHNPSVRSMARLADVSGTIVFLLSLSSELCDFLADDFSFEICMRILSLPEQLGIRCKVDQVKQLANRLFTRYVCNTCLGVSDPFAEIDFNYNELGKPTLPSGARALQFSASTSNQLLATVVQFDSTTPIGIDLSHFQQNINPTTCVEEFRLALNDEEFQYLLAIPDTEERYLRFNQIWTLKEAFTKLLGSGLHVDLSHFGFHIDPQGVVSEDPWSPRPAAQWSEVPVKWRTAIRIDPSRLFKSNSPYVQQLLSDRFHCQLASLFGVTVSLVSQAPLDNARVMSFDLLGPLEEYIKNL